MTTPPPASPEKDSWAIVLAMFGLGNLLNGLWMLGSPAHWYINLPAGIPETGPLNEHFVRDIGCIFFLMGAVLLVAIPRRELRLPAMIAASAYSAAHALVHVYDTWRGLFEPGHWQLDVAPIYVSTLLLLALTWKLAQRQKRWGV